MTLNAAKSVLRTDPNNVQALILQAVVQQKQKKWADSLATLSTAARIAPKDSTVLCMQGLGELQLGKTDQAVAYFERAITVNPKDTWASELLVQVRPVSMPAAKAGTREMPLPESIFTDNGAVTTAEPGTVKEFQVP
jgi:Tfp pilus assembly protein PilF